MNAVETSGLTKRYGPVHALSGANLRVPAGSIFGFLGPNGAGKTTTLRILVGLLRPTAGVASVLGRDAWRDSTAIRREVGYLPGDPRFHDWMTAAALLAFIDRARGGSGRAEMRRLCDRFELDPRRRIRDFSRGMKQKVGLIQAMMHRPRLLILDEPTAALDPLMQRALYDELRAAAAGGRTILLSSHTLGEVDVLCDRVAIIRRGVIIEEGAIDDLRRRAARQVEFRMKADCRLTSPPPADFVPTMSPAGVVRGCWTGTVDRLLAWLSGLDVADASISPPRLEDLFAAYYRDDAAGPPADGEAT